MAAKSRDKGQRGEREVRDFLRAKGWAADRGAQQGAGGDAQHPDVIHSIPGVHIEVKRVEAFSCVQRAMEQSIGDAGNLEPTVWSRSNRGQWFVTMRAEDYLATKEFLK
jgi:hypothetical protein